MYQARDLKDHEKNSLEPVSENNVNFDSIEKNSIELNTSYKIIYLQDRENKIKNTIV